jgi:hypothetical protein
LCRCTPDRPPWSSHHSLFDTDADEPGMVIEAALFAAERQQVGILEKRLPLIRRRA